MAALTICAPVLLKEQQLTAHMLVPVAGGGLGLYTSRPYKRNELITEYAGPLISFEEAIVRRHLNLHSHIRALNLNFQSIDGLRSPVMGQGGASFANDARSSLYNNAVFVTK